MHEVGEQPIFVRGELDRIAIHRDAPGAGVEPHRPAVELALGVASRASQQRPDPRQHLLEMKRLGRLVVGAGIEALHLVAPAVTGCEHQTGIARPARRQASSTEIPSILGKRYPG